MYAPPPSQDGDGMMSNMKELLQGTVVLLVIYVGFQFVNSPASHLFGQAINGAANTTSWFLSSPMTMLLGLALAFFAFIAWGALRDVDGTAEKGFSRNIFRRLGRTLKPKDENDEKTSENTKLTKPVPEDEKSTFRGMIDDLVTRYSNVDDDNVKILNENHGKMNEIIKAQKEPITKATLERIYLTNDSDTAALDKIKGELGMTDEDFKVLTKVSRAAGEVRLSQALFRYAVKGEFHSGDTEFMKKVLKGEKNITQSIRRVWKKLGLGELQNQDLVEISDNTKDELLDNLDGTRKEQASFFKDKVDTSKHNVKVLAANVDNKRQGSLLDDDPEIKK